MGIRTSHTGPTDFDRRARLLGYAFSLRRLQKRSHSAKTTWMTFPWMPVIKEEQALEKFLGTIHGDTTMVKHI